MKKITGLSIWIWLLFLPGVYSIFLLLLTLGGLYELFFGHYELVDLTEMYRKFFILTPDFVPGIIISWIATISIVAVILKLVSFSNKEEKLTV